MISEEDLLKLSDKVCTQKSCTNEKDDQHLWGQLILSYRKLMEENSAVRSALKIQSEAINRFVDEISKNKIIINRFQECLALAAIPLEVLRATELDGKFLCNDVKASIIEATEKIRQFLREIDHGR